MVFKKDLQTVYSFHKKMEGGEKPTTQECTEYLLVLKSIGIYEGAAQTVLREHAGKDGRTYEGMECQGTVKVGKNTKESFNAIKLRDEYPEDYAQAIKAQSDDGKLNVSAKYVESKTVRDACTENVPCTPSVTVKPA